MFVPFISEDLTLNSLVLLKHLMIPLMMTTEEISNTKMGLWQIIKEGQLKKLPMFGLRLYMLVIFQPTLVKERAVQDVLCSKKTVFC